MNLDHNDPPWRTDWLQEEWDRFLSTYPQGTKLQGTVLVTLVFGVFVRLDELPEVKALLELPWMRGRQHTDRSEIQYPDDYPDAGERLTVLVLAWCLKPNDVRLTEFPPALRHGDLRKSFR